MYIFHRYFTLYRMVFTFSWASSTLRTIETFPRHREKQFLMSVRMVKFSIKTKIFRSKIILDEKHFFENFRKSKNQKCYNVIPVIKFSDFSIFPKKRLFGYFLFFYKKSVRKIFFVIHGARRYDLPNLKSRWNYMFWLEIPT